MTHRTATAGDIAFALPDPLPDRQNRILDTMSVRIGLTRALNRIMSTKWKHNFSAGPSAVDAGVLAKLSAELASFEDTGMVSVDVA